ATFYFPAGFLWGTATASHQVEGGNTNNNWYAWEQEPGRIRNGDHSGLACDWWGGRWREDLDRAAETGQNAHRMSIEWSRVQPAADRWDEDALDHYRTIIRGMVDRGMTPLITLHHFTDPLWLTEQGGWQSEKTAGLFAAYVKRVVEALQEYVSLWVTINEPNTYVYSGFIGGEFPPGKHSMDVGFGVMANMVRGHAQAYAAIHAQQRQARVGIALNYRGFLPASSWSPLDKLIAGIQHRLFNQLFPRAFTDGTLDFVRSRLRIPEAAHTQDFLGVNYYTRDRVAFSLFHPGQAFGRNFYPKDADLSGTGFISNEPEGMFEALRWARGFKVPLIVTENGVEDADDHMRPRYLAQHVHQVWRAVNFNWQVKGYFYWTLVDNFEWERGWSQRFGLWELDVDTQARRRRPSADLYAAICRENGLSSEMVRRYAPEVFSKIFPG
ncbi:MAG TPA: glycoside hydrolase family 1 protein, partial [Candidatus Methylomirabilis sp.]|nr:glycoside hydrolase family 1 protein [Candidatus Methylomirabilis sp.]